MKTPQLPHPKLAKALSLPDELWLKREDLHHYGSHKGRSIPLMINEYRKQGVTNFIISSSGNAALAAILAIQKCNQNAKGEPLKLTVLVGEKINTEKFQMIAKNQESEIMNQGVVVVEQCARPKQTAFQMEKEGKGNSANAGGVKWLRQSTDDMALVGYQELAGELTKIPNLAAVFIPTSSGTTAQGLYEGFSALGLNPEIHIVQTEECHPMVNVSATTPDPSLVRRGDALSPPYQGGVVAFGDRGGGSLATAIVDKIAHRKNKILEILKISQGAGWVASNQEIKESIKLTKEKTGIEISPNSALSVVGLTQAIASGKKWDGAVVCLVTGR